MKNYLKSLFALALLCALTLPAFAETEVTSSVPQELVGHKTYLRHTLQEYSGFPWYQWDTTTTWTKDRQWSENITTNWGEVFTGSRYENWPGLDNAEYEWEFLKIQHEARIVGLDVEERAYITHMYVEKGEETVQYKNGFTGSTPTTSSYWINTYRYLCDEDTSDEPEQPVVGQKQETVSTGSYTRTIIDHGIGGTYAFYEVDLTAYSSSQTFKLRLYGKDVITNDNTMAEEITTSGGGVATYLFGIFSSYGSAYYDYELKVFLQ